MAGLHELNRQIGAEEGEQKDEAQAQLTGATAAHTAAETPEIAPNAESTRGMQGATTEHLNAETDVLKNPQPSLATAYAHAVNKAIEGGQDPTNDPIVQHLADAITSLQKEPKGGTPPHITSMLHGKPHIMERDPNSGEYSIDRGEAPPNYAMMGGTFRLAPAMLDTAHGNAPITMNVDQLNEANAREPGRYIPAGVGEKALGRTALIEDIRGNINSVRDVLKDPNMPSFSAGQRAKLAIVLGGGEKGPIDAMTTGAFMDSLAPAQQDYVIHLSQLVENAMAMRSVLGAGQGSEQLRDAIRRTIPTAANPNPQYSMKQLDAFEAVLNRLEKGVPKVALGSHGGEQEGGGGTGLGVNLKDAMALPQNKGKSEADVRKDIEAHGHRVVQ